MAAALAAVAPGALAGAPARPLPALDGASALVRFRPGTPAAARRALVARLGGRLAERVRGTRFVRVRAGPGGAGALLARLAREPRVARAAPNLVRTVAAGADDPLFTAGRQDYLYPVGVPGAWAAGALANGVVVAVVDTGVDAGHPDLAGRVLPGADLVDGDGDAGDDNGHGTMMASIAAARTGNAAGLAGVAWDARILPVRVADASGRATDADLAAGIAWAADRGADVVNVSMSGPGDGPVLRDAVAHARRRGALVVAAAGNDGTVEPVFPAADPSVLAVAAADGSQAAPFTNRGPWVDIAAPGAGLAAACPGPAAGAYCLTSGTSGAAAVVSGVAALVRARNPAWGPEQVAARLVATARDLGAAGTGAGMVDAAAATGAAGTPEDADVRDGVPAGAAPAGAEAAGVIGRAGDVDWLRVPAGPGDQVVADVTGDVRVQVYDAGLRHAGGDGPPGPGAVPVRVDGADGWRRVDGRAPGEAYLRVSAGDGGVGAAWRVRARRMGGPSPRLRAEVAGGTEPGSLAVADLTADPGDEVALLGPGAGGDRVLTVLPGDAAGTPAGVVGVAGPAPAGGEAGLAAGDVTGDGRADVLAVAAGGVLVWRRSGPGLDPAAAVPGSAGALAARAADLDGDGLGAALFWWQRCCPAAGGATASGADGAGAADVAAGGPALVGDVDGDGRDDLVEPLPGGVLRVRRPGAGGGAADVALPAPAAGLALGDVTGDGRADVVAVPEGEARVLVLAGRADGGLAVAAWAPACPTPAAVATGDVDGDGRGDVLVAGCGRLAVLLQGPSGAPAPGEVALALPRDLPTGTAPGRMGVGDLDGDGARDVALASVAGPLVLRGTPGAPPPGPDAWVADADPRDGAVAPPGVRPRLLLARPLPDGAGAGIALVDGQGRRVPLRLEVAPGGRELTLVPLDRLTGPGTYRLETGALGYGARFAVGAPPAEDEAAPPLPAAPAAAAGVPGRGRVTAVRVLRSGSRALLRVRATGTLRIRLTVSLRGRVVARRTALVRRGTSLVMLPAVRGGPGWRLRVRPGPDVTLRLPATGVSRDPGR